MNKHSKKSDLFKEPIRVEDELTLYASTWLQPLIDKLLSHPIAPPRWGPHKDRFIKALKERALSRGTNPKYELRRAARTAISLTLSGFSVPARLFDPNETDAPLARAFVRKDVRKHVNNLVTKDLLGTKWRRHDVSIDEEIPDSFDPDELIEILDNQERTAKLLDALTPRQRQVIQLIYKEDSTLEAAGKKLGITKQTVDEIHKAALKKLSHKCRSLS